MAGLSYNRASYDTLPATAFGGKPPQLPPPRVKPKRPQVKIPVLPPMRDPVPPLRDPVPPLRDPIPPLRDPMPPLWDPIPPLRDPISVNGPTNDADCAAQQSYLSLADFVKKHGNSLPLRVMVKEGFCGNDERTIISAGDVYNFHFIKKEKVMSIQDAGGTHTSVPINTAVQFGIVYDPVGDIKQAAKGYSFKTIGELADYTNPPRIVKSTKKYSSGEQKSSIESDEILIVKSIGRTVVSRKYCVKVHSMLTQSEKTLYGECEGCFVTAPGSIRLYLTDINEFFNDQLRLPQKAMIFLNSDVNDESITHLASEVITLTHISVESSIIATNGNEEGDDMESLYDNDCPISIPIYLDIAVEIIDDDDDDYENLYDNTMELFDNFNPSQVKEIRDGSALPTVFSAAMRKANDGGYQFGGMEIQRPAVKKPLDRETAVHEQVYEALYDVMPSQGTQSSTIERKDTFPLRDKDLNTMAKSSPQSSPWLSRKNMAPSVPALPPKELPDQGRNINQQVLPMQARSRKSSQPDAITSKQTVKDPENDNDMEELRKKVSLLSSSMANLSHRLDQLQDELKILKEQSPAGNLSGMDSSTPEKTNIKSLRSLSYVEIVQLLEHMNLSQYRQVFENEQLDGDTLADCDDSVLLHELKIENKLHRIKLMKIITGKHSAINILEGKSPYVVFKSQ